MALDIQTPLWQSLLAQDAAGRPRSALITDVDNTFYRAGHDEAIQAAWRLRAAATEAPYPIIAVTGNSYEPTMRLRIESGELPAFEAVIGSVGTELWLLQPDGSYAHDKDYDDVLRKAGYERAAIVKKAEVLFSDVQSQGVDIMFQDVAREAAYLRKPDPSYLPYKVSTHFFADDQQVPEVSSLFERAFPKLKIIVCEEINHNATLAPHALVKKYCLDILPATKADAVNYLIKRLKLVRGVVAGDSGNDADMLLDTPESFIAVVVGGHKKELKAALKAKITHPSKDMLHMAGGKPVMIDTHKTRMAAQSLLLFDGYLRGEQVPSAAQLDDAAL